MLDINTVLLTMEKLDDKTIYLFNLVYLHLIDYETFLESLHFIISYTTEKISE